MVVVVVVELYQCYDRQQGVKLLYFFSFSFLDLSSRLVRKVFSWANSSAASWVCPETFKSEVQFAR